MPKAKPSISLKSNRLSLEKLLNLKQLQISRILNITQAINSNLSEEGLYGMYKSFLTWELGVSLMALYTKNDNEWQQVASQGLHDSFDNDTCIASFEGYKKISNLQDGFLFDNGFELIIPVHHKDKPIAYVMVGKIKLDENEERYNVIQLITAITNIIAVAIENKRLFKRQLEQERLKKELELGRQIQQMLVPQNLPVIEEMFEMDCIYLPKMSVGGDYYDFIKFNDYQFAFCIGDISGKGIGAALLMANFQANFQSLIRQRVPLEEFISALNTSVNQITKGDKFITFFVAEVDLNKGEMRYINAGHNPPLFYSGGKISELDVGCTILGSFDELPEINKGIIRITAEDFILCYTDGVFELKNDNGNFFPEKSIGRFLLSTQGQPVSAINQALKKMVDDFKGNQAYPDDLTILSCRIKRLV